MHGRLKIKTTKEIEEEQRLKKKQTLQHYEYLTNRLLDLRCKLETSIDNQQVIFKLSAEILLMNSDFYTIWNIRREALIAHVNMLKQNVNDGNKPQEILNDEANKQEDIPIDSHKVSQEKILNIWKDELSFTSDCLKKNEKSYSVWHHRIWVLLKMPKSTYETEILICNAFLSKDERNFHCWDYRSYISDVLAERDLEKEFEYTTEKIRSNFSNFSAWHRRHKLLTRGLGMPENKCPKVCNLKHIWNSEYQLVVNALFTDPADQSPWWYHNWLVKNSFGYFNDEHMKNLKLLEELERDNRWLKEALVLSEKFLQSSD